MSRRHLVLLNGTARQLFSVLGCCWNVIAKVLSVPGVDKQNVRHTCVAALESRNAGELVTRKRIDKVLALIYKVYSVRVADRIRVIHIV